MIQMRVAAVIWRRFKGGRPLSFSLSLLDDKLKFCPTTALAYAAVAQHRRRIIGDQSFDIQGASTSDPSGVIDGPHYNLQACLPGLLDYSDARERVVKCDLVGSDSKGRVDHLKPANS